MRSLYISPTIQFMSIETYAATQASNDLALQAGCPGELFSQGLKLVAQEDGGGGSISTAIIFKVSGQVTTDPALPDLKGCTAQFNFQAGGSDTFNIDKDCTVNDFGNGEFTIQCVTPHPPINYSLFVDCSAKGYGTDTSSGCNINPI